MHNNPHGLYNYTLFFHTIMFSFLFCKQFNPHADPCYIEIPMACNLKNVELRFFFCLDAL